CKNCLFVLPFELSFNAFLHLGIASKLALLSTSETVLTRLVSHTSPRRRPTHAISIFSSVSNHSCFSTFFSTSLFSVESECKDTTIFQTGKIFFQKKFSKHPNHLKINTSKTEKIFSTSRSGPRKTPLPHPVFSKNRHPRRQKTGKTTENRNILLTISILNKNRQDSAPRRRPG
ncbi:MAG: hypothetical protein II849_01570, partial [Bacteroidales bacterium]|nr:hypothetical protein [Bacteroidales bacterium]